MFRHQFRLLPILLILPAAPAAADSGNGVPGLRVPPGFYVTEIAGDDLAHDCYTLTINPKGEVIVAGRGYIRRLIDNGTGKADRAVEIADHPKDGAMGLLWEGDTLWAVGDGGLRRFTIGPDGRAVGPSQLVYKLKTGGEHTAHALRRGPDGWLYWLCGNETGIGEKEAGPESSVHDPVAGAVLRFSPDMSRRDVFADGFRNPYGFDFDGNGELFTFDSDNERCVGLPWYEGCRLYHVDVGGHYGWRSPQRAAFWRMPPYFPDVIAPIADLGRGSPTGVACYRHRQFPEKYRGGLFLGDWTFGRIYHVTLNHVAGPIETAPGVWYWIPHKYMANVETFLESVGDNGFAPTGLAVHPTTGDLYVSIGGRGTRGAVYRIRYEGGIKDAAGFTIPPLPHKDPPLPLAERHGSRAHKPTAMPLRSDQMHRPSLLFTIREWERKAGDIGTKAARGTVFEGYTVPSPEVIPAWFVADMGASLRINNPARLDNIEQARLFAIVADGDPTRFRSVADMLTASSDPLDDTHYLIVLARMTAPRTPELTATIADALLGLDSKLTNRGIARDTNWLLRIAELHAELARKDPRLNAVLLEHPELTRPNNVVFIRCPGFDRRRAAERFFNHARQGGGFPWSPELVTLMGELPTETGRPLLLTLWDRGGFEDAILPILAKDPRPANRDKFVAGLRSPQLSQIAVCLTALESLPPVKDPTESLALVRALRSLGESKAEIPIRDRIARRLQTLSGESIGPDKLAWTAWLGKMHPDLAAKLGDADGVDLAGWQKRLAGIEWTVGDAVRGQAVFTKASCASCHSGGSAVGPDLRGVGGRFGREDLLTAILQPSKDIAARYRTVQIGTRDGKAYQGVVIYEAPDGLMLQTGPAETVRIAGDRIESRTVTDKSLMPAALLDKLTDREIADLVAYLKALK
jgi:putative heme-binding domain-containing protein